MGIQDLEHNLRILVELDLFKRIRAIREGNFPNEEEMIQKAIQSFENALPEWTNQISDCHSIVIDTLERTEKAEEEIKKMRHEEKKQRQEKNER